MSLQGSKRPKQETESALPGPAGYEPAGLIHSATREFIRARASVLVHPAGKHLGMEDHLGPTCDPVGGLVQIPCIERNAVASVKPITAARLALHGDGRHAVSLDKVIKTMMQTGADMKIKYHGDGPRWAGRQHRGVLTHLGVSAGDQSQATGTDPAQQPLPRKALLR